MTIYSPVCAYTGTGHPVYKLDLLKTSHYCITLCIDKQYILIIALLSKNTAGESFVKGLPVTFLWRPLAHFQFPIFETEFAPDQQIESLLTDQNHCHQLIASLTQTTPTRQS